MQQLFVANLSQPLFYAAVSDKKVYATHGISWPDPQLLVEAKARAGRLGLSLSQYVNRLVKDDIDEGGNMILKDPPPAPPITGIPKAVKRTLAHTAYLRGAKKKRGAA